ncbi:receptor-type tyrosine-protein phosphatase eta-like isoform X1 [Poeciliopsis prolifica]|uniref:receptor-type tyrosine-protein phosphatase eta-like isoform X1 n=1 Tax=Poeciliopsis prolifica TaxID=188132 RepID=UPI0024139F62|nr:receptor-type tyrosine-protein phosphatase eta-like isoform X1 [Poeciliopsis prolifica]
MKPLRRFSFTLWTLLALGALLPNIQAQNSAPTNTTAAPTNPTAAPTNPTAAPTTMTAAPTTMTAAPTTMTAAPTTMTAAPTTMTAAPTTMTAAPTTMTAAPTTMTAAPTTMTAAPTTMTAAPTTTMAVPTTTTAEQTTRIKAPGNVSNLFVESITTSSVKVIWNKTEDARYRVYWKNGTITSNETVTENFKSITGLDPGVQYNITVTVVANDNVTEGLPNTKTVYTRPVKPVKVQVESRTSDNITITWALPEGRVDHYSVNISNSSSNYSNLTVNATRAVFSGLLPGRIFIFTVTAVAGTFTSTSDQFSFATYPLYVKSFNIYQRTNSSLYLQWNISEKMEGAPDISYAITYNHTNDSVSKNCSTDKTDIALDDLQPGTSYTISITTVGPEQLRSTPVTIYAYTLPNAVTNLNVNFVNTTSVQLSWSRQADYKNSYKYLVEAFLGSEQVYHTSTPNETASFNSLTPGTLYTFQVSTVYEGVKSTNASINKYTIPAQVSDLSVIGTTSSLSVSWTKAVGQVSSYFIRLYNGTNSLINNTNLTKETTQFRFEDLKPGVLYHVEVVTKSGPEENNIRVSNATFPNPPGAIMVDFQTNKSINFSWPLPANMGASQYFTVVTINGFNNTQKNWFLLENLESGSKYTVSVVTVGALNYTSTERSTQIYTRPNSVTGLTKTKVTTSSVTLEWNEPSSKPPFIYEVQLGSAVSNVSQLKVVNTTTTTFDGLESGSKYNFTVTTITEDHTQAESVTVFYYTSPHNVKSLKLDPDEEHINLTWNRPDQYKDTYRFFVTWQSREWTHARNTTTEGISYSITELTPGIEYNITIITKTSDGTESATQTVSSCTNASPVRNLTCNGPNNGDAKIILSWTKPKGNYSNFKFTVTNTSTLSYANGVEHTISNLTYHSIYGIEVETQSCGKPSTPQWKTCQTGVAKPPIPSGFGKQMSKTHNTFTLRIQTGQINNSKGPVTHIGILVTSDDSANITDIENFLGKTYSEWRAKSAIAYLATVMNYIQTLQRSSVNLDFEIGNGSKWEGYANDALDPTGSYRYAVVVCTYLVVKSGKIDTVKSVCSISALSDVIILDKDPAITSTAIGATLGIFGVLFIILIGFIIYWKRLSRKESPDIQIESVGGKVSVAVRVEDFETYYRKQKADSSCGFAEEFEDLKPVGTAQAKLHALALENKPKNRYNNVLPYDSSRVKLSVVHGSPNEDYINANYMPGYLSRKEFIAAQGPLPATVNEFWRMIWEKNVQTLVMLTRCNEQGRVKCEQYWSPGTKYYEEIVVTTTSEIQLEDWTIRDFDIKNVKTTEVRSVRHFHFTAWPDHGVPETTELLISFRHLVREHMNQYSRNSPTVVHCSAGVGRTGTFIAIDRLIFQIERENIVDVYGIVHDLRMHRPLMVQTEDQYVFLNQCALDIIRARTGNNVDLIYQNTAAISIYENVEPKRRN